MDNSNGKKYEIDSDIEAKINSQVITNNTYSYNTTLNGLDRTFTGQIKTTNINWKNDFEFTILPSNGNKKLLKCSITFENDTMIEQIFDHEPKKTKYVEFYILSKDENELRELMKELKSI